MKDVWAVTMDEDTGLIVVVEGIAADVIAFIDQQDALVGDAGKPFRENAAGKPSADDEVVVGVLPEGADGV